MKIIEIPEFETRKELFKFLHLNQETLINQKKSEIKFADGFSFVPLIAGSGSEVEKSNELIKDPPDVLETEL